MGNLRAGAALTLALLTVLSGCSNGSAVAGGTSSASPATSKLLPITGQMGAHDPDLTLDEEGRPWLVYYTGVESPTQVGPPQVLRSDDGGTTWSFVGSAWPVNQLPAWVKAAVPRARNVWAPTLYEHDGTWYLYYAVSSFGSQDSVVGLMTGKTPDPAAQNYGWTDAGQVFASHTGDAYNAIDPTIVEDAQGTPWLFYGSFWAGIYAVQLEWPSGLVAPGAKPVHIATRDAMPWAVEAASVTFHGGYYYLFVSWDSCCQGIRSTYSIHVGRSQSVTGPYVDESGVDLLKGGGTLWFGATGRMIGPGGQSAKGDYLAFHYYDGDRGGTPELAIAQLAWQDGWPAKPSP